MSAALDTVVKPTRLLSAAGAIEVVSVSDQVRPLAAPAFVVMTKPTSLFVGSVVAKGTPLNVPVAADVTDSGERFSALLLLSHIRNFR